MCQVYQKQREHVAVVAWSYGKHCSELGNSR